MKKLFTLLLGTMALMSCTSQNTASEQATGTEETFTCMLGDDYQLVWHEEFDGTELDLTQWQVEEKPEGWVNHELQNYVNQVSPGGKRTIDVSDGILKLTALEEDGKIYSGRIYGNKTEGWKYGYMEARIKLPSGKGTWPAFWMMPVEKGPWPLCGEIDIMEEVGYDKDNIVGTIHCAAYNHVKGTQKSNTLITPGAEGDYHVYALEWTEDYIKTYVDGNNVLEFPNDKQDNVETWPFSKPFYVILNLAWGGDWGGSQGIDPEALPITMEVDYVRVFQKK